MSLADATLTASARYYRLHAEERKAKSREKYNSDPEVIRKREEREKKRLEKEAEKEIKRIERDEKAKAKLDLALATSKKKTSS